MSTIIELKDLEDNVDRYADRAQHGESFIVSKQSKPIFKITPVDTTEEEWETVLDFRSIKDGGVKLSDLLARL
jgi:prevent-host-death family protein